MQLINVDNGHVIAEQLRIADRFWSRFKGLMLTKTFPSCDGLMIQPCQSIHTFFMRYAIDVIYLDQHNEIIDIHYHIKPGQIGKSIRGVKSVVELPIGTLEKTNTKTGQTVQVNY